MSPSPLLFDIREGKTGDEPIVLSSWLNELRYSPCSRFMQDRHFFPRWRQLLIDLMQRMHTQMLVACDPQDDNHIYGYIVFTHQSPCLHWLYVKEPYRGFGVARTLLSEAFPDQLARNQELICSHASKLFFDTDLVARYHLTYIPLFLQDKESTHDQEI